MQRSRSTTGLRSGRRYSDSAIEIPPTPDSGTPLAPPTPSGRCRAGLQGVGGRQVGRLQRDGHGDLAVSANGHVAVMYGTRTGLSSSRHQVLAGNPGTGDGGAYSGFGESMAAGDLDGDGYGDLVVGFAAWPRRCRSPGAAPGDCPVARPCRSRRSTPPAR
ncbi:FG-GAP-like repeat-containing protein [Streptomyces populi]